MAFCIQCGAQHEDGFKFCPTCGAAQSPTAQAGSNSSQANNGPVNNQSYFSPADDIADNKGISVLCYLGILLLIPLLTKPDSPFVKFHSNQGLVLLLLWVALGVVAVIPILGWIVSVLGYMFSAVCFIIGIINVLNGETKELPLIGSIKLLN